MKNYSADVDRRSSGHPHSSSHGPAAHCEDTNYARNLVRSECLANAGAFWETLGELNDRIRLSLLKEYNRLNTEASEFFSVYSDGEATLAQFLKELDLREPRSSSFRTRHSSEPAPAFAPRGRPSSVGPTGGCGMGAFPHALLGRRDLDRCPFPLSRLPRYTFITPPSASYPRFQHWSSSNHAPRSDAAAVAGDLVASQLAEIRREARQHWAQKSDGQFRVLEENLIKGFGIGTTFAGYKSMSTALKQSAHWKGLISVQEFASQLNFKIPSSSDESGQPSPARSFDSPPKSVPSAEALREAVRIATARQRELAMRKQQQQQQQQDSVASGHRADGHGPQNGIKQAEVANASRRSIDGNKEHPPSSHRDVPRFRRPAPGPSPGSNDIFSFRARVDEEQVLNGLLATVDCLAQAKDSSEKLLLVATISKLISSFPAAKNRGIAPPSPPPSPSRENGWDDGAGLTDKAQTKNPAPVPVPANPAGGVCIDSAPHSLTKALISQLDALTQFGHSDSRTSSTVGVAGAEINNLTPEETIKLNNWIGETVRHLDLRQAANSASDPGFDDAKTPVCLMTTLPGAGRLKRTGKFIRNGRGNFDVFPPEPYNSRWKPEDSIAESLAVLIKKFQEECALRRLSNRGDIQGVEPQVQGGEVAGDQQL